MLNDYCKKKCATPKKDFDIDDKKTNDVEKKSPEMPFELTNIKTFSDGGIVS
jgi:hypothetical protein